MLAKRYGGGMDLLNFFFYRLLLTTLFLFVIAGVQGELAWPETPTAWGLLLLSQHRGCSDQPDALLYCLAPSGYERLLHPADSRPGSRHSLVISSL